MKLFIGIDPGASGGVAAVSSGGEVIVEFTRKMPDDDRLWHHVNGIAQWRTQHGVETTAVLERVGGFRKDVYEGTFTPGNAMFNFGHSHGACVMALIASGLWTNGPTNELHVPPQRWQAGMKVETRKKGKGGETRTEFKRRLKELAQELFPTFRVTMATADALLMAEYARRTFG
jgi:hypothetical protein